MTTFIGKNPSHDCSVQYMSEFTSGSDSMCRSVHGISTGEGCVYEFQAKLTCR
jgi:hypothetical protein